MQLLKKIISVTLSIMFLLFSVFSIPINVKAEELTYPNVFLDYSIDLYLEDSEESVTYNYSYEIERSDFIAVRFYEQCETLSDGRKKINLFGLVFSKKPFSTKAYVTQKITKKNGETNNVLTNQTSFSKITSQAYNGLYYGSLLGVSTAIGKNDTYSLNAPYTSTFPADMTPKEIRDYIAKDLDIAKDEYEKDIVDENGAVYNKDLDFLSISGDYKVKYTIQKDADGKWNFITPDEAGLELKWVNRKHIDNSYVNITVYGDFYESFWKSSSISSKVSYKNVDRFKKYKFLYQKDMINEVKNALGKGNAHGFVVKYIYIQSFGVIDGVQCRGRVYKLNSNLVYAGNGSSDDLDAYTPEFTDGSSMPDDYTPDDNDVDPEKTEPNPDKNDDTIIDLPDVTPVPDVDYGEFSFDTVLDAWGNFWLFLRNLTSTLGQFPQLLASVFSFLPSQIIVSIGLSLLAVVVLRFLGR